MLSSVSRTDRTAKIIVRYGHVKITRLYFAHIITIRAYNNSTCFHENDVEVRVIEMYVYTCV